RKRRVRDDRGPDAIARDHVAAGAIVGHRHHGFGGEHPAVVKLHRRHGIVGRANGRGDGQRTGGWLRRIFYHRAEDRTSAGAAGIGSAGSWGGEETPGRGRCWLAETKRYVLELRRVGGRERADHRHSVRRHQRQVLAIRRELEIRV